MLSREIRRNIPVLNMPVGKWLERPMPVERKIAGLLDYGYSPDQISVMLQLPYKDVGQIILDHNLIVIEG